jgi:hypothetical protein
MSRSGRFLVVLISSGMLLSGGSAHGQAPDPTPTPGPPARSTVPAMPSISPVVPSTLLPFEPSGGQVTALEEYNPCNTSTGDPYDVCKNYVNHRPG